MNNSKIAVVLGTATAALSLLSVIYAFGVVWRVEKKLDISFKLFLLAILSFLISEILGAFYFSKTSALTYLAPIAKMLFAFFFLSGMITMRNMIRRIDGEK